MSTIDLSLHGITMPEVLRNLHPARLYEEAIRHDAPSKGSQLRHAGIEHGVMYQQ